MWLQILICNIQDMLIVAKCSDLSKKGFDKKRNKDISGGKIWTCEKLWMKKYLLF